MGSVYKRRGRDGKPLTNYSLSYFDHTGNRVVVSSRTSCKRTAERILREKEARVAGILNGTIDIHAERFQEQAQLEVTSLRHGYLERIKSKGKRRGNGKRSKTTIRDEEGNLTLFFEHSRASALRTLGDLTRPDFIRTVDAIGQDWIDSGLSGYTVNQRLGSVRRFLAGCLEEGLIRDNPLEYWQPYAFERKRVRRPLTDAEVHSLLDVARGRGRYLWYLVALRTGLRRSEMGRLAWGDVDLEAGSVRIPAHKTKSRRTAVLPMTCDLREAFREARPKLALPSAPVFPALPSNTTRRKDFKRAGIAPVDEEGRHADLHSLRVTLGTALAREGVSPQLTQEFMRHSDYRTTREFYTHLRLEDLSEAAAMLEAGERRRRDRNRREAQ
jgi:integrase